MSYIPGRDFLIEVQKGNVPGHTLIHKFGRNDDVASATWEAINLSSAATSFLAAATTVRVKAGGNAADTVAGAGAQGITIEGLDETGAAVSETEVTAGASASTATTTTFMRINRFYVSAVGTYGVANTAIVTLENGAGGTDLGIIGVEEGQSQTCHYTIPLGKTGYLLGATLSVDAAKAADIRMFTRLDILDVSTPMGAKRLKIYFDGVQGILAFSPKSPGSAIPALTDIWWEAEGGGGAAAEVSVDFEILLVDN